MSSIDALTHFAAGGMAAASVVGEILFADMNAIDSLEKSYDCEERRPRIEVLQAICRGSLTTLSGNPVTAETIADAHAMLMILSDATVVAATGDAGRSQATGDTTLSRTPSPASTLLRRVFHEVRDDISQQCDGREGSELCIQFVFTSPLAYPDDFSSLCLFHLSCVHAPPLITPHCKI